jgi:hypothetical protein
MKKADLNRILIKVTATIFFLILFGIYFQPTIQIKETNIVGSWWGDLNDKKIEIFFSQDNTFDLKFIDLTKDSIEEFSGDYEIDFTKAPMPLTLKNITQLNYPLHTIIEFVQIDLIKSAFFSKQLKIRPISFNKQKLFYLRKQTNS